LAGDPLVESLDAGGIEATTMSHRPFLPTTPHEKA
jgi:hypothetical protein